MSLSLPVSTLCWVWYVPLTLRLSRSLMLDVVCARAIRSDSRCQRPVQTTGTARGQVPGARRQRPVQMLDTRAGGRHQVQAVRTRAGTRAMRHLVITACYLPWPFFWFLTPADCAYYLLYRMALTHPGACF